MDCVDPLLCHQCGKIFYKLTTFESHMKWKHMEKTNEYMCDQCGRIFQKKYNLYKHIESGIHFVSETVKCALCDFRALNRKIMVEHYQNLHFVFLNESNISFKTLEEFYSWKSDFENRTNSRFVKLSSSRRRKNGFIRSTFFCHRDGNFISKGRNLRHIKVKGSNKINAHCPAKIDVDISERIVIVNYIDTHLGHELDISRMTLDPVEKAIIAEKLALKVPFEQVLEELNNSMQNPNMKRLNLLTRKDLWNIVDSFKINPKSIVHNKGRARKKMKAENMKKGKKSKNTNLYLVNKDSESSPEINIENEVHCADNNAINQESDSVVVCPIIFKDENDQYFQEYALISDENEDESSTCLIVNAQGEVETIKGEHVICTENGELQIYEAFPEGDEMQTLMNSVESVTQSSNHDFGELPVIRAVDAIDEIAVQIKEQNSGRQLSSYSVNAMTSVNNSYNSAAHLSKTISKDVIDNQPQLLSVEELSVENHPEYEVTIPHVRSEENVTEYVVIAENTDESSFITSINSNNNNFTKICLPVKEIPLNEIKTEDTGIKKELVDDFVLDERQCTVICNSDLPEWSEKRKEVLSKILNVHNMINNEQQLKVFSNNISSLENVLKSLSRKNKQDSIGSDTVCCHEVKHYKSNELR